MQSGYRVPEPQMLNGTSIRKTQFKYRKPWGVARYKSRIVVLSHSPYNNYEAESPNK